MAFNALTDKNTFDPLDESSPTVGISCVRCGFPLQVGEIPALVDKLHPDDKIGVYMSKGERQLSCHIVHEICVDNFPEGSSQT